MSWLHSLLQPPFIVSVASRGHSYATRGRWWVFPLICSPISMFSHLVRAYNSTVKLDRNCKLCSAGEFVQTQQRGRNCANSAARENLSKLSSAGEIVQTLQCGRKLCKLSSAGEFVQTQQRGRNCANSAAREKIVQTQQRGRNCANSAAREKIVQTHQRGRNCANSAARDKIVQIQQRGRKLCKLLCSAEEIVHHALNLEESGNSLPLCPKSIS